MERDRTYLPVFEEEICHDDEDAHENDGADDGTYDDVCVGLG